MLATCIVCIIAFCNKTLLKQKFACSAILYFTFYSLPSNKVATRQKMLQIHDIFNLVATLYETRLLQPEISIWVMSLSCDSFMTHHFYTIQRVFIASGISHEINQQRHKFQQLKQLANIKFSLVINTRAYKLYLYRY